MTQARQLEITWGAIDQALDDNDWQKILGLLSHLPKETEAFSAKRSELTNRLSQEFIRLIDTQDASSAAWVDYLISYLDRNLSVERKTSSQTLLETVEDIEAEYGSVIEFRQKKEAQVETLQSQLEISRQEWTEDEQ